MFESQQKRQVKLNFVSATLIDVVLAFLIANTFSSDQDLWFWMAAVLAFLWLAPLFFFLRGIVYRAVTYFTTKRIAIDSMKREFRAARLPVREWLSPDADTYFQEVANIRDNPDSARIYSANVLGALAAHSVHSFAGSFVMHLLMERALSEYFDEENRDARAHEASV